MTAHLTLPYNWVDCAQPENCQEHIHLEDTADVLNSYPTGWVEELIGNCKIYAGNYLIFTNSDGQPHKNNGPAIERVNGEKEWRQNGQLHREDGPAVIFANGTKQWYLNGLLHRENNPAVTSLDGIEEWWVNGHRHREDGPAVTEADGTHIWWLNSKIHRDNGPAVIRTDDVNEWWINGVQQPTPTTQETGTK